ncbi:MAG: deoxyribonuclease IV [Ignavibacteria bacterium]|jgi:deoxyribonuclease-4|nr:deoxyribonuclease IV [Ignavibacteria bacterium]MDH7527314.1 deoxyribonuclease IV [Ignavibacteria bacterium]
MKILLGAHTSIAGGVDKAVERAARIGCTTFQLFTKNSNQWYAKPLNEQVIQNYKRLIKLKNLKPVIAHDSYLINLCAKDKSILKKSREAFIDELNRCELLGIDYLNFHPGSHMGMGELDGIKLIAESINIAHDKTKGYKVKSMIETTAGQGTSIGFKFEQIRKIIDLVEDKKRLAVCVDTCHIFAAGYDIRTEKVYEKTFQEFDEVIGLKYLKAFHMNDSKKGLGERVDRHEHIGKGKIGLNGFRFIMNDERFISIPKILETPKGEDMKEDIINMRKLLRLVKTNLR